MHAKNPIPIITIDGPSGSGKGTLCCLLSQHLGWHMLDSGIMYRLLALAAVQQGISLTNDVDLARVSETLVIDFRLQATGELSILLENIDVTLQLRTEQNAQLASQIAAFAAVRTAMLKKQREFCREPGLVADGRDMGSVVFPQADLKLFLTASVEQRAKRRYDQLKKNAINVNLQKILTELKIRDKRDSERAVAPLKPGIDSIVLDSSQLTIEVVFKKVLALARAKGL